MIRRDTFVSMLSLAGMGILVVSIGSGLWDAVKHPQVPQIKPFCTQMREEAEQECGIEMENSFMDQGGDNYTRGIHLKDITKCRRIGEAVSLACNNYGKE